MGGFADTPKRHGSSGDEDAGDPAVAGAQLGYGPESSEEAADLVAGGRSPSQEPAADRQEGAGLTRPADGS